MQSEGYGVRGKSQTGLMVFAVFARNINNFSSMNFKWKFEEFASKKLRNPINIGRCHQKMTFLIALVCAPIGI